MKVGFRFIKETLFTKLILNDIILAMKHISIVLLIIVLFVNLAGCGSSGDNNPGPRPTGSGRTFPYNATYPYGLSSVASDQTAAVSLLQSAWSTWQNARITTSGAGGYERIQRDGSTSYDTVSEGMGYGMLLAVYFGNETLFDNLYSYAKKYLDSNGLMNWQIDSER